MIKVRCLINPYGFVVEEGKVYEAEDDSQHYYDIHFGNNTWGVYPKSMFMRIYEGGKSEHQE